MPEHFLTPLLAPRSIAFVGASSRPNTPGNDMIHMARRGGFSGDIFPINANYEEIEGLRCFPSLAALPGPVDLAVLAVGNQHLDEALAETIRHRARAATIFASCYLENDARPPLMERLAARARAAGMPICGGNCMGFYNDTARVWVCGFPSPREPHAGGVTFISHAGSVFGALAHNDRRLKFNLVVSAGQELVTTTADYIDYALAQAETRVIGLFIEAVRDPEAFARALDRAAQKRIPVVALKVGRTEASAAMALSHSGAVAGNDAAYRALFDKYGVLSVDTIDELATTLLFLSQGRRAAAGGLAAIHDSGGERELVVDLAERHKVPFAAIGEATVSRLKARLEYGLDAMNPLDAWGTGKDFEAIFADCFAALMDDPDTALGIFFNDLRDEGYLQAGFAEACRRVLPQTDKPVAFATNYTQVRHDKLALALTEAGVPVLDGTVPALQAARHLLEHRDFLARAADPPPEVSPRGDWRARLAGRGEPVAEAEALELLADYGIPVPPFRVVENVEAAVAAARAIGYPVVCKTATAGILHKTERGGVKLNLPDETALRAAYRDLAARVGASTLVAAMAEPGVELALGIVEDRRFGTVVMVAAGGVLVELLGDARYGLAPFGPTTARRLLDGIAARKLLDGFRGAPSADLETLALTIARFSVLAADLGPAIATLDVNPLIVSKAGCVAVDALIIPEGGTHRGSAHR